MDLFTFLSRYGISKTTNFDLKDMSYDLGLDIAIIMRNEFVLTKKNMIIMNLQTTKEKGTHWVSISKSDNIYFDPYGVLPTKEVFKVLPNIKYNETQIQPEGTEMCGQLSLYVLYRLNLGEDFETIIETLNFSFKKNDN